MASSEVDQKFLGRLAKAVERDNPFLAQILFRILGLSLNLAEQLVAAKKQRHPNPSQAPQFVDLIYHILWLSREGLNMLEQYVLPWVGPTRNPELIVLAWKLRASFLHIYVLFYNQPSVSPMNISNPDIVAGPKPRPNKGKSQGKGKGVAADDYDYDDYDDDHDHNHNHARSANSSPHSPQPTHGFEGGPVGPPPGLGPRHGPETFVRPQLIMEGNYLPLAHEYFRDVAQMADELLWGSHSLRLSVKTEYAAFLYECVHDLDASRKLAKDTINEVYEAQEGMDDDMFDDACELVAVLGKMKKRGLGPGRQDSTSTNRAASVPLGMENPI